MKITSQKDFDSALSRHKPGDSVVVTADRRGLEQTFIILCAESPELEIVPYEDAHIELTGAMKDFRDAWLGSKSLTPLPELWKYCPKCGQRYAFPFEKCPDDDETLRITREELSK